MKKKEKQKGGSEEILWIIMGPIMVIIGIHLLYIIYLKINGRTISWDININRAISEGNDTESMVINYIFIFLKIIYNILIKPYKVI